MGIEGGGREQKTGGLTSGRRKAAPGCKRRTTESLATMHTLDVNKGVGQES